MAKAFALLQESDMPVSAIAQAVGYCGDGHFHQSFRQVYGTTPGKLRQAAQNK